MAGDTIYEMTVDPTEQQEGGDEGYQTGGNQNGFNGFDEDTAMALLNQLIPDESELEIDDYDVNEYDDEEDEYEDYEDDGYDEVSELRQQLSEMRNAQNERSVFESVGGKQNYERMTQWAASNLSPREQAFYDQVMESGDLDAIQFAVKGLQANYRAAHDSYGRLNFSNNGNALEGFGSMDELANAMADSRYQTDERYRATVERRAAISNIGF